MWGVQSRVVVVKRDKPSVDVQLPPRQGCVWGSIHSFWAKVIVWFCLRPVLNLFTLATAAVVHGMQRYA